MRVDRLGIMYNALSKWDGRESRFDVREENDERHHLRL
jgi:hypothetical protein